MSFLCDTNVISEVMKPSPNPQVQQWLREQEMVSLSVVGVEENKYDVICFEDLNLSAMQRLWGDS